MVDEERPGDDAGRQGDSEEARAAFVDRLFRAAVDAMDVAAVYVGDRLGLYRTLAREAAMTAPELAAAAAIDGRYAREWLEQQAATGVLDVEGVDLPPEQRRFSLPAAHAEALVDPESPYSMAPLCRSIVAAVGAAPTVVEAFRTGDGVGWEAYGQDMVEAQGDFNRPWLVASFATEYLPAIPDVHARLRDGGRVADVACGVGWAAIAIARAYPSVTVDGFDLDEASIALARRNADAAGVSDRVHFAARDARDHDGGRYDLAVVVEALHDMSRPVDVLAAIRETLAPAGAVLVADERVSDSFVAPADDRERLFYGYSVLTCLPSGRYEKPSAATGTVMRRSTLEAYAAAAGYRDVSVLPIDHDFLRFYRLDP
jgi:SAM-dependent methyltransferase